jgi:hypothetical protein
MVTETIAEAAFKDARKWYESGFKSSNKDYDPDTAPWYKRLSGDVAKRNRNRVLARDHISATKQSEGYTQGASGRSTSLIERGKILYNGGHQAGNCEELTNVACFRARFHGASREELWAAELSKAHDADHTFCIFCDPTFYNWFNNKPVKDLSVAARGLGWRAIAIDPWANTCCPLEKYPDKLVEKMRKWLGQGKRVNWNGVRGNSPGMYPTDGDYATTMMNAPVNMSAAG